MTTPERHNKVYELFVKARELDANSRQAFLDEACAGDPALRAEVEARLAQQGDLGDFLEKPLHLSEAMPEGGGADTRSSDQRRATVESDSDRDQPHLTIEGYEIVRELHRGGQGVVYQAIQKSTKRKVAIKFLREGPYATKSAKVRFKREIEFAAQLKHPNIITVFESGTTPQGWQYYVMDYVRGLPFNRHVRENGLGLEDTLRIVAQVCDAVQYAHHRGVIHRDLKPSNILIDSDGNPKVLDFGLAKQLLGPVDTIVSLTQEVIGTLPYMSPEQAKGNPDHIDMRTDVYALGVILYETLTGHYPYPVAGNVAEVLKHIADTPPTPPSRQWTPDSGVTKRSSKHLRAGKCPIDDELQTVILKTLAKERERRYQSAGDLAEDINHYLANEPIEAKRDSGWYVFKKAAVRHKAKVSVASLITILVSAFGVYVHQRNLEDEVARIGITANDLVDEGAVLHLRKRYRSAQQKFDEALRLVPDHYRALGLKAFLIREEYVLGNFTHHDLELMRDTLALCDQALAIRPSTAGLWNLKGALLISLGQLEDAEKACRRSLQENPSYYPAHIHLSKVLALQGNIEAAIEAATDGVLANQKEEEKDKYDDGIWRVLGTLQLHLRDAQVLDSLNTTIEIDRKDQRSRLMLARLYLTLDEYQDDQMALEQAKMADALTSLNDPRFKRILAQAHLQNAQYRDALTNAEAALKRGDKPAYSHLIASTAASRIGNPEKSKQHLEDAKEKWPEAFTAGKQVIVSVEKELLWFDTIVELNGLLAAAESLVQP
ncbi:MAG: protein kinase [Planctomycetes bacterium]|nr:protein kinase [Planctomycetota bacterium]